MRCIAFRPGVIDIEIQTVLCDCSKYYFANGSNIQRLLRTPASVAKIVLEKLVEAPIESGRVYSASEFNPPVIE